MGLRRPPLAVNYRRRRACGTLSGVRVLLVEDDAKLAERTAEYLREHGIEVEIAGDGDTGLIRAIRGDHELVLLDLMLPRLGGLEVLRQLRERSRVPVIMLTARGEEADRVLGLEVGADDYVAKPFSPRELVARIRAVHRRAANSAAPTTDAQVHRIGPIVIDRDRRRVDVHGQACELTPYQFDILWILAEAAEHVLSREQLYNRVRALRGDPPGEFDPSVDRSVDVHLSKIRQGLAALDADAGAMIRTIRGVGYVLGSAS
ncbi:MAG: response regulator transcription factor [Nannocystis sp.]|nr:response regulator transcription factor [Nannocystis sp.]